MHYRTLAAFCLAMAVCLGVGSTVIGQNKQPAPAPKAEPKVEPKKEEPAKEDPKEEPKVEAPKPMTHDEYDGLMKKIKTAQGKVKAHLKNKKGADTATAAEDLAKHAAEIMRFDGDVKEGDNKGKKVREQKDFKEWAEALKKAAENLAKHAKAGKWDDADTEKDNVGRTCSNCHDVYDK